jgi:homoserine acetyltransferase
MISYRTAASFEEKFGRQRVDKLHAKDGAVASDNHEEETGKWQVESYLEYQVIDGIH